MIAQFKNRAIVLAILVTFLWATSWVFIKIGLDDIPPVTFAGLRYFLGFLILLPLALRGKNRESIRNLRRSDWRDLMLLGAFYYTINQGAMFAALALLPAMSVSLILTFTSLVTAGIAVCTLGEKPTWIQWAGISLNLGGAFLYFFPIDFPRHQWLGILLAFIGMLANAVSTVIGRKLNQSGKLSSLVITTFSMGIGSTVLLATGLLTENFPIFSLNDLFILVLLATVNTALAFTLWNKALQHLEAFEASVINNLVAFQIAILAWVFLGERLSGLDIVGIMLAAGGAIIVQLKPNQLNGILSRSKMR